jgi:hypothetical protein
LADRRTPYGARSNEEWIAALSQSGPRYDVALEDLRTLLVRGLGYALANHSNVRESDLKDFAQNALLQVLDGLHTFRGESRFITWGQKKGTLNIFPASWPTRRWGRSSKLCSGRSSKHCAG